MQIDRIRRETPGCRDKLFVNSAGASLMPQPVLDRIQKHLLEEQEWGGYKAAENRQSEIAQCYAEASKLIHGSVENIALVHDATEAFSRVLSAFPFQPGDVIVTTDDDYASSHLQFLSLQKRFGVRVHCIRTRHTGDLDLDNARQLIEERDPALVAVAHVPTNSGLIQDVAAVGAICAEMDVPYMVDACQSVGQLSVDVGHIQCDFLSATGRKFLRGPRGTGFLYVSDKMLARGIEPLFIDGRGALWLSSSEYQVRPDARRFETWEAPYALILGLKEALAYANNLQIEAIQTYNDRIVGHLRERLAAIHRVQVYDKGSRLCNIMSLRKEGVSQEEMQRALDARNVVYSMSDYSWAVRDFAKKGIDWTVRISPHYFNTVEEMDRVADIFKEI